MGHAPEHCGNDTIGRKAMKRRRLLTLAGAMLAALVTAHASAQGAAWEQAVRAKHNGTEIRVLAISHPATDAMRAMTADFEKATGIKVTYEVVGSGEIMAKQGLAQTARDSSYDVYMVRGVSLAEYDAKRMLAELGPYLKNADATPADYAFEDIHPAYRDGLGVYNNKVLAVPIAGETFFIAYRKDLFDKYSKMPPNTTDELLATAKFFQNKEPGLYGIAMRAETGRTLALSWDLFTPAFGGAILDQKTWDVKINTPDTIASLKYLLALLGNAPPDIETFSWDAAASAFAGGKTAMWFDATSLQPWLVDPTKSKVVGKVAYAPPPQGPKGRFGPVGGWSLGLPANAKNKDAGWAFIVWMTSKAHAKENAAKGGVPSRVSLLTDPEFVAKDPSFAKAMKESLDAANNLLVTGRRWVPPTSEATKIHQVAGQYAGQALLKKMTPEAAVAAAVPELEQIAAKIKKAP
jgi:ABC-type glycerol-3-phosphate transport system substrate-binding protein